MRGGPGACGTRSLELAARDDTITELRHRSTGVEAQAKAALDEARGELEFTKSTLAEKESGQELDELF